MNGNIVYKMDEVILFLESLSDFSKDETWVVAVSGGPDSMALLYLLQLVQKKYPNLSLVCVHINHNTGRIGQKEEQEFLKKYSQDNGILFEMKMLDSIEGENFHHEARKMRYSFFQTILDKYRATYLFTGHHADDLIETILMRMGRGSTLEGYHGFSKISKFYSGELIRPFIQLYKDEILEYVIENKIPYFVDSSNQKDVYTRNRVRKYIATPFKKEYPDLSSKIYKFSTQLEEYYNYVDHQVSLITQEIFHDYVLDISLFEQYDEFIRKQIIMKILEIVYQEELYLITDKHVEMILEAIASKKSNLLISLPQLVVTKAYHFLYFKDIEMVEWEPCFLKSSTDILGYGVIDEVDEMLENGNDVCRLSYDDVELPLSVRIQRPGDVVSIKGMQGSKKLNKVFIDCKVPLGIRKFYPLVVDASDKIVWIPGVKKTKFDKTKEEKYDIILKYYEGGKK